MIVLGIDPGLAETGWGAIVGGQPSLRYLGHGVIRTAAGLSLEQRLGEIHLAIGALLSQIKPRVVAIEALFFARNAKSALPVAHARGVVYATVGLAKLAVFEYTPKTVKLAVCGSGQAEKTQVQSMVGILLGLRAIPQPNHAADALATAICHANSQGRLPFVS